MCNEYDCNNRPLGLQDAEMAWNERQRKAETAMTSDIYTNGGLLDRTNAMGYEQPAAFYPSTIQQILERDFSYEELKFIAGARLPNMSMTDIDRLISLLEKLKKSIKDIPVNGLPTPVTPSTPSWGTPYYGIGGGVQPLYGCPIPQHVEAEAQKGPNEPDEQSNDEKMPSFLGSAWNDPPVRTRTEKFYGIEGIPFPEKIGKKKDQYKKRVVLSAEEIPSKADIQNGPNEPDDEDPLEETRKLFGTLAAPSSGIVINENPVPLTEENKSVDEEKKND